MSRERTSGRPRGARVGPQQYLRYRDPAGREHVIGVGQASVVEFADCLPVRAIPHYRGSRHTPGEYWAAGTGRMVAYESWLECQWMMLLDFDPRVVAFAGQPFEVGGVDAGGVWRHVPDLFVRRIDGSALVMDVKNPRHLDRVDVQEQAERTREICSVAGFDYELVGLPDRQFFANVAWLHGFRRPLHAGAELVERVLALAAGSVSLQRLVSFLDSPELARPVVFHLLWHGRLRCDLTFPLRETTVLHAGGGLP